MLKYGRPYDRYVIEGLCSLIRQLEKTVVRLQQDIVDYRAELKIRTHTPTPEVSAVEKLLQRLVTGTPEVPAVVTPAVEKLLQCLVTYTQSRPVPTELEQPMRPSLAEQRRRRRFVTGTPEVSAVVTPEVPAVEKLLQCLMTDTQSRPVPTELEQAMRPSLAEQHPRAVRANGSNTG